MIDVESFGNVLQNIRGNSFTGISDLLLKIFCVYVTDNSWENHVINANESGMNSIH